MSRFRKRKICLVYQGLQAVFYSLIIDDHDVLQNFEDQITNKIDEKKIAGLYKIMEYISLGKLLSETQIRQIKNPKLDNLYEIKKNPLRLYCIKCKSNYYIALCNTKTNQKKDIKKFIKIAQEFMQIIDDNHINNLYP